MSVANEKIGQFIYERRKEQGLTQKELADKLHITDKAVSKWERGLSLPDITLLNPLAEVLGVTTSELLSGEKSEIHTQALGVSVTEEIDNAIDYAKKSADEKNKRVRDICSVVFTVACVLAAAVCIICNLAISGKLTWSLYPLSSLTFAWAVIFPIIKYEKRGIAGSLISQSALIIPFLAVINRLVGQNEYILPIGVKVSVICIIYIWIGYFLLFKLLKHRKLLAGAFLVLIGAIVCPLLNYRIGQVLGETQFDKWDVMSIVILVGVAAIMFLIDLVIHRKKSV